MSRRFHRDDSIFLVIGFVILLLTSARAPYSWGEAARLATVEALAERGTPVLDGGSYPGQADKLLISGNRLITHKPPGMQLMLTPAYYVMQALGITLKSHPRFIYLALTILSCGSAWLFFGVLLHRRHRHLGISNARSRLLVGAMLFATLALPYGLALNAHFPAGVFLVTGLLLLAGQPERFDRVAAGLLFGLAFSFDHAAMFFVATAMAGLLLRQRSSLVPVIVGTIPGILVSTLWYKSLGDSWLPLVFQQERFDFAYSPWLIMSLTGGSQGSPFLPYLFELTFGQHGLFSNHPILLFPLAGLAWQAKKERDWVAGAALAGALITIVYYAATSRNRGGDCFGIRWLAMIVPPLAIGLPVVAEWIKNKAVLGAFLVLLVPSATFAVIGAQQPWMKFHLSNPDPLREDKPLFDHLEDEFERRRALPPEFSMQELRRFYHATLRRLASVTATNGRDGARKRPYEEALAITEKMLVNTREDPVLWEVHGQFLEALGRSAEAQNARQKSQQFRERNRRRSSGGG